MYKVANEISQFSKATEFKVNLQKMIILINSSNESLLIKFKIPFIMVSKHDIFIHNYEQIF